MRLGLNVGYAGANMKLDLDLVVEAERLGYDSAWTAEAYGSDAFTPLSWIGARTSKIKIGTAIAQFYARTPAMTAMTAMTLDALSGGRFILGLGPSGPQVVEGWHGVPYRRPLTSLREYVAIVRQIVARKAPLQFQGVQYQVPYTGPGATGLGKPLRSILHGRPDMKIYTAAIGPKGIALSAEIADGLIPTWFNPERFDVLEPHLKAGLQRAPGKSLDNFDLVAPAIAVMGPDVAACRSAVKRHLALYVGGMGARSKNFYTNYVGRLGYEEASRKIQDLYLSGRKDEAAEAVPDRLVDDIALVGPRERIRDRLQAWKASPVSTMLVATTQREAVRAVAELCL